MLYGWLSPNGEYRRITNGMTHYLEAYTVLKELGRCPDVGDNMHDLMKLNWMRLTYYCGKQYMENEFVSPNDAQLRYMKDFAISSTNITHIYYDSGQREKCVWSYDETL